MTKNILIIPHTSTLRVRVRSFEIGKALSRRGHTVYYWHYDSSDRDMPAALARIALSEFFKMDEVFPIEGVNVLRTSRIYRPHAVKHHYNDRQLARIVKKFAIDTIICAEFSRLSRPRDFNGRYLFDYVDDSMGFPGISEKRKKSLDDIFKSQFRQSNLVIASSECLQDQLVNRWGIPVEQVIYIPNGVWSSFYRATSDNDNEVRCRYSLPEGRRIASFIGNHANWSGVDFVYDLFSRNNEALRDWILLLVGPSYREFANRHNVVNLGTVPWSAIPELIKISDCGLLPFHESDFTSHALPLKVVEYSVLGKPLLASPLRQVGRLGWPNICTLPLNESSWIDALTHCPANEFEVPAVLAFDWELLAERLEAVL